MGTEKIHEENGIWKVCTSFSTKVEDSNIDLPVSIEGEKATIYLLNEKFKGKYGTLLDIPEKISVSNYDELYETEPGEYIVSTIVIKCKEWHLSLPETIEEVFIDRDNYREAGTSENSDFCVHKDNKIFQSDDNGSLYSKDGKVLYHYHISDDSKLSEDLEEIRPGAIFISEIGHNLVIPPKCTKLVKDAIYGDIEEIVFLGALKLIEKDSLSHIYNHFANCTIRINGTLSDINDDGKEELRKWIENPMLRSKNEVIFAAPKPCGRGDIGNGFIELSEVIDIKDKMLLGKDTRPILINADINEGTVIKEEEKTDISNVPIIIRPEVTSKEETYNSVDITRITFATNNEMNIRVLEKIDVVEKLIKQSYKKNTVK
jgi:hypothetical protein